MDLKSGMHCMRKIAVLLLTRMSLPNLGADDDPVDGEEGAEEERHGERAQHVPVEDVHAHEIAYLGRRKQALFPRCHCTRSRSEYTQYGL